MYTIAIDSELKNKLEKQAHSLGLTKKRQLAPYIRTILENSVKQ